MPERAEALDPRPIRDLANDLGPAIAVRFLGDYLVMLPGRLKRILTALQEADAESSTDAILSLKISSAMNGAVGAEAVCRTLESLVHRGCFESARAEARKLSTVIVALNDRAPILLSQVKAELGITGDDGEDSLAA